MSFKFGLGPSKKGPNPAVKQAGKKPSLAFGDASDDEQPNTSQGASKSKSSKSKISQYGDLSSQKTFRKALDKALEVDPSIYDYDAAYDAMQARNEAKKAEEREKALEGESKYMENLLAAKTVREKDYLRAKESKTQRERVEEGDLFADKEKFVTGAYKKQQEELRIQEAEEKKREAAESKKRGDGGQAKFLRSILDQGERMHSDAMEAAASLDQPKKPAGDEEAKKSESEIARELNAKGANIALTDDGEIADKRQLLSAGLNVMMKPKKSTLNESKVRKLPHLTQQSKSTDHKGSRDRQTRMMETQLEQMLKRQADEEAEELRQKEHAAKSQKTSTDVSSARERYLQRKKAATANEGSLT
jgi:coiled-coil domain-containing protein 55